jgi:hypothetical protein
VPLSDAARRLLAGRNNQPDPAPPAAPAPAPAAEPVPTSGRGGFRDRAKREEERFRLATDSEYWIALCFRKPGDPAAFAAALRMQLQGRYLPGPAFAEATSATQADTSPAARVKQMLTARGTRDQDVTGRLAAKPATDPLAQAAETGGIQAESDAELVALHAALTATPDPDVASIHDSPYWLVVCWSDRDAKDAYLRHSGLDVLGDKYLDGYQAARILGVYRM